MLASLFGKKSDHPFADLKSAQAFLADMPKNDAHKMLLELTEWIESVTEATDFKLEHLFVVVSLLDETAQPYARKLAREYFAQVELKQFQENRLWLALGSFYRNVAQAYFLLFTRYRENHKGADLLKPSLSLIVARALYALRGQLKYVCSHYGPVDSNVWANLALLYRHAEQQQYVDTPVKLYAAKVSESTVKQEFARLLVWYGAGVANLSPLYLHLTERLFAQYCSDIEVQARLGDKATFSFDLNSSHAPVRVNFDATVHASVRFVSMSNLRIKLEALLKTLEKNIVPSELNLMDAYDAETVREAVWHLLTYLNAPPLRRNVRRAVNIDLNIAQGFSNVLEHTEVALDFNQHPPLHWQIEDIGLNGFRTVLPSNATVRIGSLLGMQAEGVAHWGVAVVRRMSRDEAGKLHVGAEILANQIVGVLLSQSGGGATTFEDGQPALLLYGKSADIDAEVKLLMKDGAFSQNRSLLVTLQDKHYLLIPVAVEEKGTDYDLAKFRVIQRETAEAA